MSQEFTTVRITLMGLRIQWAWNQITCTVSDSWEDRGGKKGVIFRNRNNRLIAEQVQCTRSDD